MDTRKVRVVVLMDNGLVQDVLTDDPGVKVELAVADRDLFRNGSEDGAVTFTTASHGKVDAIVTEEVGSRLETEAVNAVFGHLANG